MNASGVDASVNQTQAANNAANQNDENTNEINWVDKVYDEDEIMNSAIFTQQAELLEDPRLKDNEMHRKLCVHLNAFYLSQEKIRLCGLTPAQEETIRKTGFSNEHRI